MEHHARHVFLWKLFRPIFKLFFRLRFNFKSETYDIKGPVFVMANHVTEVDPLYVFPAFKQQMYFVASEHLVRKGIVGKLLYWAAAPISRQKGGSAVSTVRTMLRYMKDGYNVMLFPEGNRTWDGVTRDIPPATARLAKTCGATLVTYRLSGLYFANPRWAGSNARTGKAKGEVMGIYPPEELKKMSNSQIEELIKRDLFVDAYADQEESPVAYKGKNIAQHLETLIYYCPKCKSLHTMKSENNRFYCTSCGCEHIYTEYGYLEGEYFKTIPEWCKEQDKMLTALCKNAGEELIFTDEGMELYSVEKAVSKRFIAKGNVTLYKDRLVLPDGTAIPVNELTGLSNRGETDLYIGTADERNFILVPTTVTSTVKYFEAAVKLGSPAFGV